MRYPIALLFGALLFSSCLGNHWARTPVAEERNLQVFLEHYLEDDVAVDQGYAHPFTTDPAELVEILRGLEYQVPQLLGDPEAVPVFSAEEALRLAPALVRGLADADRANRLRFVSHNMGGGLIFSSRRITEGVLFVEPGGVLNIAFSRINDEVDPTEGLQSGGYPPPRDPLKILSTRTPLIPKRWYTQRSSGSDGRVYPLWAVVSLNAIRELYEAAREEKTAPVDTPPETEPSLQPVKAETPPAPPTEPEDAIKEKLRKLKEYYEEGLIDEEEYKAQKEKVLKGVE